MASRCKAGGCAWFTCLTRGIVQQSSEDAALVWYATHPDAAGAVMATLPSARNVGGRFPLLQEDGNIAVKARINRGGVFLNGGLKAEPLHAVAAQLKLVAALGKHSVHISIDSTYARALEELLTSIQRDPKSLSTMLLCRLRTAEFGKLVNRCKLLSRSVLNLLCTVEHLELENSCAVDLSPNSLGELVRLQSFHIPYGKVFSLLSLQQIKTLVDIDVSMASITQRDIILIGKMMQLRRLVIDGCTGVTSLTPLHGHPTLCHISAMGCANLRLVGSLETITTLRYLNLSHTVVCPIDLRGCLKGLGVVRELLLDKLTLREMRCAAYVRWQTQRLSLRGMRCADFTWITALVQLRDLSLDETRLFEKELVLLCTELPYLSRISVTRCASLLTTLECALDVRYIMEIAISRTSLWSQSVLEELRRRGVICYVV
uniref:Uncharacterized protein (Putative leucine-rich repeat protein (Lrrp)) n=1 Tax=Trypanosoma congolense (strain IL3000) TaxID=1068625 RepID=G0UNA2_TRYCI|nr:conserved hypothetical protein [Trypanosoma congolense IL3000]